MDLSKYPQIVQNYFLLILLSLIQVFRRGLGVFNYVHGFAGYYGSGIQGILRVNNISDIDLSKRV